MLSTPCSARVLRTSRVTCYRLPTASQGFYGAISASDVLDVINVKMHKLTIMPQILQPSKKAIKEKTEQLREMCLDVALTRYPKNQVDKWSRRSGDINPDNPFISIVITL